MAMASKGGLPRVLALVPSIVLAIGACVSIGLWYFYMTHAQADTERAAQLMQIPTPPAFSVTPILFIATLAATVAIPLLALAAAPAARASCDTRPAAARASRALGPAAGALTGALLFLLALWLVGMLAVTVLWASAAMITEESTLDSERTLRSVDPAIQRLIFQATGGAINSTTSGFIISVGSKEDPPVREVNIGSSSCSLFCFVFSRAMMSLSHQCSCDIPVMVALHELSGKLLRTQLVPACACIFAALVAVLGLLVFGAGQRGAAAAERRGCVVVGGGGAPGAACGAEDGGVVVGGGYGAAYAPARAGGKAAGSGGRRPRVADGGAGPADQGAQPQDVFVDVLPPTADGAPGAAPLPDWDASSPTRRQRRLVQ